MILDDDIIPGINCFKSYMNQCINLNSIIGGNGRIGKTNKNIKKLKLLPDTGIRNTNNLVDFVGHLWCFRKAWLYYMFSIEPYTYDTGEDMHLCFTSKLLGNISSYIAEQKNYDDMSDITNNKLADDQFSSFRTTNPQLRINVEKYFTEKYKFQLIDKN